MAAKRVVQPKSPRGSVRDRSRELFRSAILDAAEHEFASSGFHGAHMQAIAQRAGLAVGTIYNHFRQKEDVLLALLERRVGEMLDALTPAKGDPKPFGDRLVVRLARVLELRERHAAFFALATELGLLGDTTSAARQLLAGRALPGTGRLGKLWLEVVDEGVAANVLSPALDRELLAASLKGTLRAVGKWSRESAPGSPLEAARLVVDVFLHGCGVRPERASTSSRAQRVRGAPRSGKASDR